MAREKKCKLCSQAIVKTLKCGWCGSKLEWVCTTARHTINCCVKCNRVYAEKINEEQ